MPTKMLRDDLGMLVFAPQRRVPSTLVRLDAMYTSLHSIPSTSQLQKEGERRLLRIAPDVMQSRADGVEKERLRVEKERVEQEKWRNYLQDPASSSEQPSKRPPVSPLRGSRRRVGEPARHTKQRGQVRFGSEKLDEVSQNLIDLIAGRWSMVRQLFVKLDLDGNGKIDRNEWVLALPVALNMVGHDLSEEELVTLFDHFDKDRSGFLEYRELAVLIVKNSTVELDSRLKAGAVEFDREVNQKYKLRKDGKLRKYNVLQGLDFGSRDKAEGNLSGVASDDPIDPKVIIHKMGKALASKMGRVSDLFREWDVDGSGEIDKREFCDAMEGVGLQCSLAERSLLFDHLDVDHSGTIEFAELVKKLRRVCRAATRIGQPYRPKPMYLTALDTRG